MIFILENMAHGAKIQNSSLLFDFLGPMGHDPYGCQGTGNGSHHCHIYVSANLASIGLDNGLSPGRDQAIT